MVVSPSLDLNANVWLWLEYNSKQGNRSQYLMSDQSSTLASTRKRLKKSYNNQNQNSC